ncbi:TlpA disulfide reductase family protein [Flavobacterium sp. Arc3]|jgi:thiol-disulfide isomerase/thioredoxin|uniref:TlpA family protein disulfide reductase n=1 Tax=unclassified Flavobacterium TaxID=196869 RepID=UPI00352C6CD8
MKTIIKSLILGTLIFTSACNNSSKQTQKKAKLELKNKNDVTKPEDISYDTKPEDILKDFITWYDYDYYNIRLAQDFIALDTNSTVLYKTQFLNKLLTGKFFAIKTALKDSIPSYKLFKLNNKDSAITSTIMQSASSEISNYKMEGKKLPDFNFTDLNGVVYNRANTKGKILILKCWFIHCVACVKEFPELNQLVKDYKQDKNVIFLSLASDNKNDLINFLKKKQFNYAVIPNSDIYMKQSLGVQLYPTHLFVDENGKIQKVVNNVDDLIAFIRKSKL